MFEKRRERKSENVIDFCNLPLSASKLRGRVSEDENSLIVLLIECEYTSV